MYPNEERGGSWAVAAIARPSAAGRHAFYSRERQSLGHPDHPGRLRSWQRGGPLAEPADNNSMASPSEPSGGHADRREAADSYAPANRRNHGVTKNTLVQVRSSVLANAAKSVPGGSRIVIADGPPASC